MVIINNTCLAGTNLGLCQNPTLFSCPAARISTRFVASIQENTTFRLFPGRPGMGAGRILNNVKQGNIAKKNDHLLFEIAILHV
jgi:hypothetical protein